MKQLQPYDYEKLENMWREFPELVQLIDEETSAIRKRNLENITDGIQSIFNESSDEFKELARLLFWEGNLDKAAARALFVPTSKLRRMKRLLLKETAERICWI